MNMIQHSATASRDIYDSGLRGRMPLYFGNFLTHRSFRVKIGDALSMTYYQETGVPQGGVVSESLLALKIRGITSQAINSSRTLISLYVDDLQISHSRSTRKWGS